MRIQRRELRSPRDDAEKPDVPRLCVEHRHLAHPSVRSYLLTCLISPGGIDMRTLYIFFFNVVTRSTSPLDLDMKMDAMGKGNTVSRFLGLQTQSCVFLINLLLTHRLNLVGGSQDCPDAFHVPTDYGAQVQCGAQDVCALFAS